MTDWLIFLVLWAACSTVLAVATGAVIRCHPARCSLYAWDTEGTL